MKTLAKALFASSLAFVLSTSALFAAASETPKPTSATNTLTFKRIMIKGNVELTIVQGSRTGIAYDDSNSGKVKVTQKGDGLDITSENNETAKITVYVNDIYRIHAMDDAKVKTRGQIKAQYLQVFLSGNASLELNSNTEGLYTVIEGKANLNLSGSTKEHSLVMGKTQRLTMDKFAALTTKTASAVGNEFALLSK